MCTLLTVGHLIDGEGTEYIVHPFGSAEATSPQDHVERLWETSGRSHYSDSALEWQQSKTIIIKHETL